MTLNEGKSCGDMYREARLNAASHNERLGTHMGAAIELGVGSAETVGRWERDETTPSNINVKRMAQVYGAPELLHNYCAMQCPIGMGRVSPMIRRNFEQVAIQLYGATRDAGKDANALLMMAADGRIDENEAGEFIRIVHKLGGLKQAIDTLEIYAEKLEARGC